jgi:hypothetical protein
MITMTATRILTLLGRFRLGCLVLVEIDRQIDRYPLIALPILSRVPSSALLCSHVHLTRNRAQGREGQVTPGPGKVATTLSSAQCRLRRVRHAAEIGGEKTAGSREYATRTRLYAAIYVFPQQGADIQTITTTDAPIQRRSVPCLLYAAGRWRAAAKLGARFVDARLQLRRTEARGAQTVGYS